MKLDESGKPIDQDEPLDLGDNVIIVPPTVPGLELPIDPSGTTDDDADDEWEGEAEESESVPVRRRKKAARRKKSRR